jgi:hypothetical protein
MRKRTGGIRNILRQKSMHSIFILAALITGIVGCRASDLLSVPAPIGVVPSGGLQSQTGAENALNGAKTQVFNGLTGSSQALIQWSGLLADEFGWKDFAQSAFSSNVDARRTSALSGYIENGDVALGFLFSGRSALLLAANSLEQFEPPSGRSKIAEAFALAGYVELFMAEDYCAGVTLDEVLPGGGIRYGVPLSRDSLLGTAEAHFDSALTYAAADAQMQNLASVGLGRTLLDRGNFAAAAAAVHGTPTDFVYYSEMQPTQTSGGGVYQNIYSQMSLGHCSEFNVSDREGGNGLNFVSASDPRLVIDSTIALTCDAQDTPPGPPIYYPVKFGNPSNGLVPLATGVEARLIEAEAALQSNQVAAWTSDLNALRAATSSTHVEGLPALTADSSSAATPQLRIDVMFRERALWLFGTGTRLGDLRRMIRQYGRDASVVFPTGAYSSGTSVPAPFSDYGPDVSLTLPTSSSGNVITNPSYQGCIDHGA